MSCTICGYGFPIADGDAVTLDFEKAKEFLKNILRHSVRWKITEDVASYMQYPFFRVRKSCCQNQLQYTHEQCMRLMLHMLFRILFFVFGHPRKIEINRGCLCIKK